MSLVTTKKMFENALNSDYAVGAFNVNNMEIIQGIVECRSGREGSADPSGIRRSQKICQAGLSDQTGRGCDPRYRSGHCTPPGSR